MKITLDLEREEFENLADILWLGVITFESQPHPDSVIAYINTLCKGVRKQIYNHIDINRKV